MHPTRKKISQLDFETTENVAAKIALTRTEAIQAAQTAAKQSLSTPQTHEK